MLKTSTYPLYQIDKNTGDVVWLVDLTFTGPAPDTGVDPHIDGISFGPESGVLYGVCSGYGVPIYLVTIDAVSGVHAICGSTK